MADIPAVDRRSLLKTTTALAISGVVSGCAGFFQDDAVAEGDVDGYLSDTDNYDGLVDRTGESAVRVEVGTAANGGNFGFEPPAITVDVGTTVVWEWVDDEASHDVVDEQGAFESDLVADVGHEFDHTFDEPGTYLYKCSPHDRFGMNGAIEVPEAKDGTATAE